MLCLVLISLHAIFMAGVPSAAVLKGIVGNDECPQFGGYLFPRYLHYAPRLPKTGETLPGSNFMIGFGGKGCNQCVAAKKLGAKATIIARLGGDSFAKDYLKQLEEYNIPTNHVRITESVSSGMAQITVADSGENQIVIVSGANSTVTLDDVDQAAEVIKNCKVLVVELEITMESTIHALKIKAGSKIGKSILNAAPATANLDPIFYTLPTIFCVNETEAEITTGMKVTNVEEAKAVAVEFVRRGCQHAIITLGEQGAVYATKESPEVVHVSAEKVTPVDSTGAGDAFIGALAFYLAKEPNMTMVEMIQKSCRVASVSVQRRGTQQSFPSFDELPSALKS